MITLKSNIEDFEPILFNRLSKRQGENGVESMFVALSDTVGIKMYPNKFDRDFAYFSQKLASYHLLGPNAGRRLFVEGLENVYNECQEFDAAYCYLTEIADLSNSSSLFYNLDSCGSNCHSGCECHYEESEAISDLGMALRSVGLSGGDLHEGNIGEIDGRLVCIDFGKCAYPEDSRDAAYERIANRLISSRREKKVG